MDFNIMFGIHQGCTVKVASHKLTTEFLYSSVQTSANFNDDVVVSHCNECLNLHTNDMKRGHVCLFKTFILHIRFIL